MVMPVFNPSTQEAEVGGSLSSRLAWSTEQVPGQARLQKHNLWKYLHFPNIRRGFVCLFV